MKNLKSFFEEEIVLGVCTLSLSLDAHYERISPFPNINAIEIGTGLFFPKAYGQLVYDFGYNDIKFSRTTKDDRLISIQFIKPIHVFMPDNNEFDNDVYIHIYGEINKVLDFDGIKLFAVSQEYKFGMHFIEENNVEIVMIDSVENNCLV